MTIAPIVPRGEPLRRAIEWLAAHGPWTAALIEEACRRFDVDPAAEEFLLGELRRQQREAAR